MKRKEPLGATYTNMLDHFKDGSFEIDKSVIGNEGFYHDGRVTTYQGPFLAVFRGFIELFLARAKTDWSRISCLIAASLSTLFLCLIFFEIGYPKRKVRSNSLLTFGLMVTTAFGSPTLFVLSNAYLYNEPILWGMAWCAIYLWSYFKFIRAQTPRVFWLMFAFMGFCAGFALLSRATFGVSLLIGHAVMCLILLFGAEKTHSTLAAPQKNIRPLQFTSWKERCIKLVAVNGPTVFLVMIALFVNYGRFGNPLTFMPAERNGHFLMANLTDPNERGVRILQNGAFNFRRAPFGLEYYFFPDSRVLTSQFPFIQFYSTPFITNNHASTYDYVEGSRIPLSINSPCIFWLGSLGILLLLWLSRLNWWRNLDSGLVLGSFCQILFMITLSSVALRYQLDLLPFFIIGCFFSQLLFITRPT